jgi:hypothetical protein
LSANRTIVGLPKGFRLSGLASAQIKGEADNTLLEELRAELMNRHIDTNQLTGHLSVVVQVPEVSGLSGERVTVQIKRIDAVFFDQEDQPVHPGMPRTLDKSVELRHLGDGVYGLIEE